MELKLKNLSLRSVTHDDLKEVARMWNFEKGEISLEEAAQAIHWMNENHKQNQLHKIVHLCFAIFEDNTNKIIGWCGLDGKNSENIIHIFYLIDKNFRRLRYGTECAKKVLEYGFVNMGINRIDGACAKDNIGSQKILKKIGMKEIENNEENAFRYYITSKDYTNLYCR